MDRLIQAADVSNARSITTRVEDLAGVPAAVGGGAGAYDAVTARAVGPLAVLVEYAAPLLRPEGGVWSRGRAPATRRRRPPAPRRRSSWGWR